MSAPPSARGYRANARWRALERRTLRCCRFRARAARGSRARAWLGAGGHNGAVRTGSPFEAVAAPHQRSRAKTWIIARDNGLDSGRAVDARAIVVAPWRAGASVVGSRIASTIPKAAIAAAHVGTVHANGQ